HRPVRGTAVARQRRLVLAAGLYPGPWIEFGQRSHDLRAAGRAAHRVPQPDMAGFNPAGLSAPAAHLDAIGYTSRLLSGVTLSTNLPAVLADTGDTLAVARSLLAISA